MAKANEVVPLASWPRSIGSFLRDDFLTAFANPGVSLSEDDDHVYVEAALPGMRAADISVNYSHGTLSVNAARSDKEEADRKQYRTMQRTYSYQVALPAEVEEGSTPKARLKDGILNVTFVKSPEAKPRKIEVEE